MFPLYNIATALYPMSIVAFQNKICKIQFKIIYEN